MSIPVMDPNARLPLEFDWSKWLGEEDSITGDPTVVCDQPDALEVEDEVAVDGGIVRVWVRGMGVAGPLVTVTCHVETAAGRVDERSKEIRMRDR